MGASPNRLRDSPLSSESSPATSDYNTTPAMASVPPVVSQLETDLAKHAPRVITHMNDDHADGLVAYARAFGNPPCPDAVGAVLVGVESAGFVLRVSLPADRTVEHVRVAYPQPLESARDLHKVAVQMYFQAFDKLGFVYKVQHGYFQTGFQMGSQASASV